MLPWGHLAFGYLCYAALGRWNTEWPRSETGVVALALGTQLPDLEKVLAWWFGVIPNGRSLAHSLLVAGVVLSVVRWSAARRGRAHVGTAFVLGYLTHLFGDALYPLVARDFTALGFLAWPLVPPLEYDHTHACPARPGRARRSAPTQS